MNLIRFVARPFEAAMFVYGGYDAVRNPEGKAPRAEKVVGGIDVDTTTLVRVNGGVQIGAGIALALGVMPRVAALVLAGSLVPTTLAGHRFWEEDDPKTRAAQQLQFLKNTSMLGGLLMTVSVRR
jgi:uncharacterized membrane protein YphA (DoxX/SURF4 family)